MALSSLIFQKFGVRTRVVENPVVSSIGITAEVVLKNNPDRLGFVIINLSENAVYIGIDKEVATTKGIYLAPNGGTLSVFYGEDFELVGYEFWGVASGAGSVIYVLEVEAE